MKESHNYNHDHLHTDRSAKGVIITMFLNMFFAFLELIAFFFSNSIAMQSSALHDFGDSLILFFTFLIEKFSFRGRDLRYTYGYRRFSLVASILNAVILLTGSTFILLEIADRLQNPQPVNAGIMIVFSILGILVNITGTYFVSRDKSETSKQLTLNLKADIFNFIGMLIASITIYFFNILILDTLFSGVVAVIMIVEVSKSIRRIFLMLMQAAPDDVDIEEVKSYILAHEQVIDAHDIHIWNLDGEDYIMSFHLVVKNDTSLIDLMNVKEEIKIGLEQFKINHTTIEVDNEFQAIKNGELGNQA